MNTSADRPTLGTLAREPLLALACGLGLGLAPRAPGTFGTLLGVPLQLATAGLAWPLRAALVAALFAFGVWLCGVAARRLGTQDDPRIVWDEVVGYLVGMLAAPPGWLGVVVGFALFRLFDAWKPWPIRVADRRIHGGFGIMFDDLLAGVAVAAILCAARYSGAFGTP